MTRQLCYNIIEERLSWLAMRIELRGSLNIFDLNIHSEDFYQHLLNAIFGWKLENLNKIKKNTAGADLIDNINKLIIQVSATVSKQKIESALSKILSQYTGYTFKFVAISKNGSELREKKFSNPSSTLFEPKADILDIESLLKYITTLEIQKIEEICHLVEKEIHIKPEKEKVESNLATVISQIARVDWSLKKQKLILNIPYDIEKKIDFNRIKDSRTLIDDYKDYYDRVDQIYTEFDKQGNNKSLSVLNGLRSVYLDNASIEDPDECFKKIVLDVIRVIEDSLNSVIIPSEELRMCIEIIVVDAFIRCKIFKNPEGYLNATTR